MTACNSKQNITSRGSSPRRPSDSACNQIVAHKGIGINEQNIIQIICKSPGKGSDAELVRLYKAALEEKDKEILELRERLGEPGNAAAGTKKGSVSGLLSGACNQPKARCKSQCISLGVCDTDSGKPKGGS